MTMNFSAQIAESLRTVMYALVLLASTVPVWGADPFVGIWKLNVQKTKVISGLSPKEGNLTKSLEGDHYLVAESDTFGNGIHVAMCFTEPISGGLVKYQAGRAPTEVSEIVRRINTNTREYTRKQGGKLNGAGRRKQGWQDYDRAR